MKLFTCTESEGFHIIECPEHITSEDVQELELEYKQWLLNPLETHILNLKGTQTIDSSSYRTFTTFAKTLRQNKKHLFSISVNTELLEAITKAGMDSMFSIVKDIDEVKKRISQFKKPVVSVDIINPLIAATQFVFKSQSNLMSKIGKLHLKDQKTLGGLDICAMSPLSSPEFKGTLAFSFSAPVLLVILEKIEGKKFTAITPELGPTVQKLLSGFFDQVKTELHAKEHFFHLESPTIISKKPVPDGKLIVVLPFSCSQGNFQLEVVES